MSNKKEMIQKIRANEKRIALITKQRNETMREILKLYEEKKKGNDK